MVLQLITYKHSHDMPPAVTNFALRFIKSSVFGAAIVLSAGYSVFLWNKKRKLRQKASQKRKDERKIITDLKAELQSKYTKNKEHHEFILAQKPVDLIALVKAGKLKAVDVLDAYTYKALTVNEDFNCVTNALHEAFGFVKDLKNQSEASLPLYGLPVSLKECINVKGHPTVIGFAKLINVIHLEDSLIAATFKHCGAIPFARTNLPQSMMSFESSNPVYGETGNHLNNDFCPGGSSSGEGCLIGAGGSPLGIGTDIAGSIRAPAHFCGICGLKPTKNRLSKNGIVGSTSGQTAIAATLGPMAREVDTLVLAMKALLCDFMFQRDFNIPPMPFNEAIYESKQPLRIGYYFDDGYLKAAPACERAVLLAKEHLEAAGHTLVKFQVPEIETAMKLSADALFADGGKSISALLEHEIVDKRIKYLWQNFHMLPLVRWILSKFVYLKHPRLAQTIISYGGKASVYDSWKLAADISNYQEIFLKEWRCNNLDAIICPSFPVAACPKGSITNLSAMMSYTVLYNLLNYPAGVVTITKVSEKDIKDLDNHRGHYDDPWDWDVKKVSQHSLDMPVSVQCVASPWNEELCLRVMKEVESLAKK